MKISQKMRAQVEAAQKPSSTNVKGQKGFDALVHSQNQKLKEQELGKLIKDITAQGNRVARHRSFRDLAKYKRMIKDFLQESVHHGVNLKHSQSWTRDGQPRKLTTVELLDERLKELADTVVDQEKRSIDILGIVGEIKGLLINLYT
ncbi:YaaR family protein [Thalassobacillus devorans]|uniref:YaaR family protein n=1 Tax=Thalassobacillus devorans TaxID=279813 RepID=UPI00048A5581|nr:YaaR family protein [Thalassobacillus devorans]